MGGPEQILSQLKPVFYFILPAVGCMKENVVVASMDVKGWGKGRRKRGGSCCSSFL